MWCLKKLFLIYVYINSVLCNNKSQVIEIHTNEIFQLCPTQGFPAYHHFAPTYYHTVNKTTLCLLITLFTQI